MPRPGAPTWVSSASCTVDDCDRPSRKATPSLCDMHRTRVQRHGSTDGGPRSKPLVEQFWSQVDDSGDCWTWTGPRHSAGYGLLGGRYAHRFAFKLVFGDIPDGAHILHSCDNPPCVRPAHLRAGTQAENMADAKARGRLSREHAHSAKLTPEQVREVRRLRADGVKVADVAREFGVGERTITAITQGESWRWVA